MAGMQLSGILGLWWGFAGSPRAVLYPKSSLVIANTALTPAGTIELIPAEAPLTLLVWASSG